MLTLIKENKGKHKPERKKPDNQNGVFDMSGFSSPKPPKVELFNGGYYRNKIFQKSKSI